VVDRCCGPHEGLGAGVDLRGKERGDRTVEGGIRVANPTLDRRLLPQEWFRWRLESFLREAFWTYFQGPFTPVSSVNAETAASLLSLPLGEVLRWSEFLYH
jgi:hypothetical protein